MTTTTCLVCGQALTMPGVDYHQRCAMYVYGQGWIPRTEGGGDE